jgi:hypothetical protein
MQKKMRHVQDSNLRGGAPIDFESIALTNSANVSSMLIVRHTIL